MKLLGVFKLVIATCALSLIAGHLSSATAAPAAQVITCVDLVSGKERISKTGTCRATEATAKWHLAPTDSALASGGRTKSLTICSSKDSSPFSYQLIRSSCSKHMQTNLYTRSAALPSKPVITQVSSTSYESVSLALARDPAANLDAPIAYYTITSSKGDVKRVNSWRELTVTVSGLKSSTSYTFTITATSVDGTSLVSESSLPVTTQVYVAPVAEVTTAPLAAPAFTLSASAETKTVNTAITGYTISSTGGTIASYAISPAAPAGLTFNTTTGVLSGTPTSTQSATAYTVTATNATGSATQTFTLTVSIAAPAFTLSTSAETKTVNTAITGYTISSTGGTISSYAISPSAPAGTTFSTSTGLLTGTPASTQGATTYTITATNASGSATKTFTLTIIALTCADGGVCVVGDRGPGGGFIYYYNASGFSCGAAFSSTGSPTGGLCHYLEAAASLWAGGSSDPRLRWAVNANQSTDIPEITNDSSANYSSLGIGLGYKNSLAIVAQGNDATTAAGAARGYGGGSKSDWYLPTTAELNLLCQWQRGVAPSVASVCVGGSRNSATYGASSAGFTDNYYWSSSEYQGDGARIQHLRGNGISAGFKVDDYYVRPIRAF